MISESSQHLSSLFLGRETLKELWISGEELDLQTFIDHYKITPKEIRINYSEFLYNKIFEHQHMKGADYLTLKRYLEAKVPKEKEEIKLSLEKKLKDLEASVKVSVGLEEPEINEKIQYEILQLNIQLHLIQLAESDPTTKSTEARKAQLQLVRTLKKDIKKIHQHNQFLNDLEVLSKQLRNQLNSQKKKLDLTGWKIRDTDYYWDLFMAGTDVQGSCQSVEGDPSLNKCLMAYVMDGKNRMLTIVDETGTIEARSIFRLLLDEETKSPVLFMEELYPSFVQGLLAAAIEKFALLRAQSLNLPLLSSESTFQSYPYKHNIQSLGSVAPWEYVDAIHTDAEEGVFSIPNAQVILFT